MDQILSMIRDWPVIFQLAIMLFSTFFVSITVLGIFTGIERFFNNTVPVLFRGWPPSSESTIGENEDGEEQ